jgi:hypothetical protein
MHLICFRNSDYLLPYVAETLSPYCHVDVKHRRLPMAMHRHARTHAAPSDCTCMQTFFSPTPGTVDRTAALEFVTHAKKVMLFAAGHLAETHYLRAHEQRAPCRAQVQKCFQKGLLCMHARTHTHSLSLSLSLCLSLSLSLSHTRIHTHHTHGHTRTHKHIVVQDSLSSIVDALRLTFRMSHPNLCSFFGGNFTPDADILFILSEHSKPPASSLSPSYAYIHV